MDRINKQLKDYVKENPDREFIGQEEDLYYCRSCLCTQILLAQTGFIYCGKCHKLLSHIEIVVEQVERL